MKPDTDTIVDALIERVLHEGKIIHWTPQGLAQLKKAHKQATAKKEPSFKTAHGEFDTKYAGYLATYLTGHFSRGKK